MENRGLGGYPAGWHTATNTRDLRKAIKAGGEGMLCTQPERGDADDEEVVGGDQSGCNLEAGSGQWTHQSE